MSKQKQRVGGLVLLVVVKQLQLLWVDVARDGLVHVVVRSGVPSPSTSLSARWLTLRNEVHSKDQSICHTRNAE